MAELGNCPAHYAGDNVVSAAMAMRSMLSGWTRADVPYEAVWWACCAFKYLWRFPLKGRPVEDLRKAVDCAQRALTALEVREVGDVG